MDRKRMLGSISLSSVVNEAKIHQGICEKLHCLLQVTLVTVACIGHTTEDCSAKSASMCNLPICLFIYLMSYLFPFFLAEDRKRSSVTMTFPLRYN